MTLKNSSDSSFNNNQPDDFEHPSLKLVKESIERLKRRSLSGVALGLTDTLKLATPHMQGEVVKTLQYNLSDLGFSASADGTFGPSTEVAVQSFQQAHKLEADGVAGQMTLEKIREIKQKQSRGSAMPAHIAEGGLVPDWTGGDKLAAVEAIKQEARRQNITEPSQVAYILATVDHETNGSFQPVEEGYYLGESAAAYQKTLRYYPYYGRGYVQITWAENYHKYSALTGLDLLNQPDWVMRPEVSLFILIDGMKRGVFTGRSLDDFTTANRLDFVEARRIINGRDRAEEIASIADSWLSGIA